MIEKIRAIKTPLTIVAIFVAIIEVVSAVSLVTLNEECRLIIVWFLVLFPTLLVALFFFTLWFKPWVLYGPHDFRDERHYIEMFTVTQKATLELDRITAQFQKSNKQILDTIISYSNSQKGDTSQISELIANENSQLARRIYSVISSLEQHAMSIPPYDLPQSRLQNDIFHELRKNPAGLSFSQICEKIKRDKTDIKKGLDRMVQRHIIKTMECSDGSLYALNV